MSVVYSTWIPSSCPYSHRGKGCPKISCENTEQCYLGDHSGLLGCCCVWLFLVRKLESDCLLVVLTTGYTLSQTTLLGFLTTNSRIHHHPPPPSTTPPSTTPPPTIPAFCQYTWRTQFSTILTHYKSAICIFVNVCQIIVNSCLVPRGKTVQIQ